MSFADNLKQARKEKGLSQEELAEKIGVSRQAVSKWELEDGYPEVEKLLMLSWELNASLDDLFETSFCHSHVGTDKAINNKELNQDGYENQNDMKNSTAFEILITSPNENVIMKCQKVQSSQNFKGGKRSPKYALYGVSGTNMLGENSTFLGWYPDQEAISKEISEIGEAIVSGIKSYELKYSVKTTIHWGSVRMEEIDK